VLECSKRDLLCRIRPQADMPHGQSAYQLISLGYRRADNPRPVSFTVSAWGRVYATNLSRLQRETEAHSVLITAILLTQRPSCYCGKTVSLPNRDTNKQNKLHGLSPRANYTDRATAASRRSDCQLLRIMGTTWSA
jgi:hypothetical protein